MAEWSTAVPDWEDRILSGRSLVPALPLNRAEADRALRVFKRLKAPDIVGKPTMAEVAGKWFLEIVEAIFGAYDPAAGVRRISEVFVVVPKKNGKSSYSGSLALTTLIVNRRPAAEFLFVAPTKTIANIAFRQAELTIKADPALAALFHVQTHIRRITHRNTDAIAEIKAADTDAITGGKNTYTLIDETHEFAAKPRADQVFVEVRGALAARPDGFLIQLTTQSKAPPAGVFKAELEVARAVRDGELKKPLLPVLYELPARASADGGWKDRRLWPLVNPNFGRSVSPAFLEDQLVTAERIGAEALALLASQHFNVEIGLSLRADRWAGADHWLKAADPALTLEALIERSEVLAVGIDGGGLDDLLALSVVGREAESKRWLAWGKSFVHVEGLRRRKSIAATLIDFAAAGELVVVDQAGPVPAGEIQGRIDSGAEIFSPSNEDEKSYAGPEPSSVNQIPGAAASGQPTSDFSPSNEAEESEVELPPDIAELVAVVRVCEESGKLAVVGLDPAGLGLIVDGLASIGVVEAPEGERSRVVGVSQGFKLMGAIKTAERKLVDGTLVHAGQALLAWAVGNAKTELKGNAVMITKQLAGAGKIDPLMALFDAVALMSTNPEPPPLGGPSVYESRGFLVV
jgi:phage terminase large subunit-like protein